MIYNCDESIIDCINNFSNLVKEGKDLTSAELPLIYFILHNNNIDTNSANQQ